MGEKVVLIVRCDKCGEILYKSCWKKGEIDEGWIKEAYRNTRCRYCSNFIEEPKIEVMG